MDTLDVATMEQIKHIVNLSKNEKVPLEKVKKPRKQKDPVPVVSEPTPELPVAEVAPEPEPKKKRIQSEKQKAAFILLQQKRKEQVEKQKLVKKIDASKLLLQNDVKLLPKKPKKITVAFSKFQKVESDDETD